MLKQTRGRYRDGDVVGRSPILDCFAGDIPRARSFSLTLSALLSFSLSITFLRRSVSIPSLSVCSSFGMCVFAYMRGLLLSLPICLFSPFGSPTSTSAYKYSSCSSRRRRRNSLCSKNPGYDCGFVLLGSTHAPRIPISADRNHIARQPRVRDV